MRSAIELTAQLLDARETVRSLHGDRYPTVIKPWCDRLRKAAEERGIEILQAGQLAANNAARRHHDGMRALMWIAATVEIIEPTPTDSTPSGTEPQGEG